MDHPVDHCPWQDMMAYDHQCSDQGADPRIPHDTECISTLDLLILDGSFAPAFDEEGEDAVTMPATDYFIHDCEDVAHGTG